MIVVEDISWQALVQLVAIEQRVPIPTDEADIADILWNLTSYPLGGVAEVLEHLRILFECEREGWPHPFADELGWGDDDDIEYETTTAGTQIPLPPLPRTPYMENVSLGGDVL